MPGDVSFLSINTFQGEQHIFVEPVKSTMPIRVPTAMMENDDEDDDHHDDDDAHDHDEDDHHDDDDAHDHDEDDDHHDDDDDELEISDGEVNP